MPHTAEETPPGFGSANWEAMEAVPLRKHEIAIEQDVGTAVAERAAWLESVWDVDGYEGGSHQTQMLEEWQNDLPEQQAFIEELGFQDTDIEQIAEDASTFDDAERLQKLQDFYKAVLEQYDSEDGSNGWEDLPEENKRYVRIAEMAILMIDARKLEQDLRRGRANPTSAAILLDILQRFGESNDVPQNYKDRVINRVLEHVQMNRQKLERLTPQQREMMEALLREMMRRGSREQPGSASGAAPDAVPDDGVIDAEFNSETGVWEPAGEAYASPETAPDETRLLSHEPDTFLPGTDGGLPGGGSETSSLAPSSGRGGGLGGGGAAGGAGAGGGGGGGSGGG